MRIGDVGSVSPAGDLLAFGLAVLIVVGLGSGLYDARDPRPEDAVISGRELDSIRSWVGFDPDGDGDVDALSVISLVERGVSGEPLPCRGDLIVGVEWGTVEHHLLFRDGIMEAVEGDAAGSGVRHSLTVVVDLGSGTTPGRIWGVRI